MRFPDPKLNGMVFHGATALERHEAVDSIALVFTTITAQATGTLRFREKGWILINRSPWNPLQSSVVRCCYRVWADQVECDVDGEIGRLRGLVQGKLTKRMSVRLKELQCELLRESGNQELCSIMNTSI